MVKIRLWKVIRMPTRIETRPVQNMAAYTRFRVYKLFMNSHLPTQRPNIPVPITSYTIKRAAGEKS